MEESSTTGCSNQTVVLYSTVFPKLKRIDQLESSTTPNSCSIYSTVLQKLRGVKMKESSTTHC